MILSYALEFREQLRAFLQPLRPPVTQSEFVDRVWEMALRHSENIVLAAHYWNVVPAVVQAAILHFYNSVTHRWTPSPGHAISLFDWITRLPKNEAQRKFGLADPRNCS